MGIHDHLRLTSSVQSLFQSTGYAKQSAFGMKPRVARSRYLVHFSEPQSPSKRRGKLEVVIRMSNYSQCLCRTLRFPEISLEERKSHASAPISKQIKFEQ